MWPPRCELEEEIEIILTSAEKHRGAPGIHSAPSATVECPTAEDRRLVDYASVASHLSA